MTFRNVVDELHDKDGLADAGTTEKTNLTTFLVRCQQIDNLTRNISLQLESERSARNTLIPVTSISISVLWSTNGGASRWIARVDSVAVKEASGNCICQYLLGFVTETRGAKRSAFSTGAVRKKK